MNRFGSNSFESENEQYPENIRIGMQLADNNPRRWNETPNYHSNEQRHGHTPNYRPDTPRDYRYENRNRETNQFRGDNPVNPYNRFDTGNRHHDTSIWTERNAYKDSDYRYRSGNRGYWHEDYDEMYEGKHHDQHPGGILQHIGEGIREGWNNMFNRDQRNQGEELRRQDARYYENQNQQRRWPSSHWDEDRHRRHEQERKNLGAEWHNSGPDHRDEDFRF
ncbi:hypothetical protein [Adhaeribacter soli]|uniref:Uncharacterized protein n=1 Tax=Adhaeribacter soli TaxID=2607655 RepID=A0A5N1J581_9BACT|nr:hypothetical protein [Adhaeribacter soli]KAA9345877.1 hypothetical protein F0P94_01995 [Adhaeribacter soli]